MIEDDLYFELRRYVSKLYHSFEEFRTQWCLDRYDFKHTEIQQRQLFEDARIVIQGLFGWSEWYDGFDGRETGIL